MNNYNTVLFDLDGTLTDSGNGIVNSVEYALKKFNITDYERKELFSFVGPPLIDSFVNKFGFSKENANKALLFYREYYGEKGIFENRLYDGIITLLTALKSADKTVILATSKPEPFAIKILKHFEIYKYFDFVVGANMNEKGSEKSQIIADALKQAKVIASAKTAMVGDRCYDIEGALKNNITPIGVTYGYGSIDELKKSGAKLIANNTEELLNILLQKNR